MFVTGLVIAAGSSTRLGEPKQLLAFRGTTLLDAALQSARACRFDQLIVTLGAASGAVRERVDLRGVVVVENEEHAGGCSSSITSALGAVDDRSAGIVLLLGDQPGITATSVAALLRDAFDDPLGICRYDDGLGHPFWLRRDLFDELRALHGDKAVWKLLESGRHDVREVRVPGPVPLDVDTREDYLALLASDLERTRS